MLPLMDMLNHDRESPNRMRFNDGAFQLVHEGDGIEAGEEVYYLHQTLQKVQLQLQTSMQLLLL